MAFDATFWVAVSFVIFFGGLIYLKIPQKINELLIKMIADIKNEIDESEKLRNETKTLLNNAQNKLDSATSESKKILDEAKKDSERLVIEMNDKFHKSAEIKKNLAQAKISQMKDSAIKETWTGFRPVTTDYLPLIGKGNIDGLYFCSGHGPSGVGPAPASAKIILSLLTENPTEMDISPYNPMRF